MDNILGAFCGTLAARFADGAPVRGSIEPADNSRIGERLKLFEELYDAFSQAMVPGYQAYASMCLYHYRPRSPCLSNTAMYRARRKETARS